jgi:methylenetetrahydrofolate dehydrogenase (NADP+)/methenyltetrahydrofolate cyclohydrolase
MIIDGRALANELMATIKTMVATRSTPPRLLVFTCDPNFETQKFLALKQKRSLEAGINMHVRVMSSDTTLTVLAHEIQMSLQTTDGIIIQFPFPHLQTDDLALLIPSTHDVDVLQYDGQSTAFLPPVVGAIDVVSQRYDIRWSEQSVVVVGNGRLVGQPAALYAKRRGALVTVVTKEAPNFKALAAADIIILGAGAPGLLTSSMVKPGVAVFDAGTSEEGGVLVGDADPAVAEKASLFTPVPGGIGPLTVAALLRNVAQLAMTRK